MNNSIDTSRRLHVRRTTILAIDLIGYTDYIQTAWTITRLAKLSIIQLNERQLPSLMLRIHAESLAFGFV